jgi:hypothetical protein
MRAPGFTEWPVQGRASGGDRSTPAFGDGEVSVSKRSVTGCGTMRCIGNDGLLADAYGIGST